MKCFPFLRSQTHQTCSPLSAGTHQFITHMCLVALACLLHACSLVPTSNVPLHIPTSPLDPGDHLITLQQDNRNRSAILHLPPQVLHEKALPLVVNLHAAGGNALQHQEYTDLDRLADQEGFVVVYPNGTGPGTSQFLTWNAGSCCGYAKSQKVDDVGFIRSLITRIQQRVLIDSTRIYATGLSNGAMMTYRLAVEAADRFAAIAPVAGTMMVEHSGPKEAVPIIHVHSLDDPRAPYEGGSAYLIPLTHDQEHHPPVEGQLQEWIKHNRCRAIPEKDPVISSGNLQEPDHWAQRIRYSHCRDGAHITLWQLQGAGHGWPGGRPTLLQRFWGPPTQTIHTNAEIWDFFRQHVRRSSPG